MVEFYNDLFMIPTYLIYAAKLFGVLILAIMFHEFGHWLYMRYKLNKNTPLMFYREGIECGFKLGDTKDYESITEEQYQQLIIWGVGAGLVVIISAMVVFWDITIVLMFIPYFIGCRKDLKSLNDSRKRQGKDNLFEDDNDI